MQIYLAVTPAEAQEAARFRCSLAHVAYCIGSDSALLRQNLLLQTRGGLLSVTDRDAPFIASPERLSAAAIRECGRRGYSGVLLDFEQSPTPDRLAFAETLAGRRCMLKLLSMNLYDMEAGSRLESLVSFKRVYRDSLHAVGACLKAHFPRAGDEAVERFLYAFFPFLFGVYPYTEMTEKQKTAMKQAGVAYKEYTMSELIRAFTEMFSAFLSGGT